MKQEGNCQNDIIPPKRWDVKELHFGMQDEEYLSSSKKNLDESFEKEFKSLMNHHVEPPWRTPVTKGCSNERKEKLKKQKVKP